MLVVPPRTIPPRLCEGDRVRLVSPASTPTREGVAEVVATLSELGLRPEVGDHVFDKLGYLAGRDEDRLADLNDAFGDPGIRAVITTRGGKGAYRIAAGIDFEAVRRDPKLLVGFSEITILHLKLLKECGLVGLHGACWLDELHGVGTEESFANAVFTTDQIEIETTSSESTSVLTTSGQARGRLIGGNQDMVAISSGWAQPSLDGAILMLEAVNLRLGHIDRQLTMLINSGALDAIVGVAVGQYSDCGPDLTTQGDWDEIDVLRDRLSVLNVPILGGLPLGHGKNPRAVPIGTSATLDVDAGVLLVDAAVR